MASARHSLLRGCCLLATAVLLCFSGCQQNSAAPQAATSEKGEVRTAAQDAPAKTTYDPADLLKKLVKTYQDAKTYEDAGELFVRIETPDGQRQQSSPIPFSVTFERPDKIRIHSLDASLVADGQKLRATIEALPDQVLVLGYSGALTTDLFDKEPMLRDSMRGQLEVAMPQLTLLLEADPIDKLAGSGAPVALEDAQLEGQNCHRVMVKGAAGEAIFWISAQSGMLLRFDFPSDMFRTRNELAKAEIWSELKGARVNKAISADAFKMEVPASAKRLTRFFLPPPRPPSSLLGKQIGDFSFLDFRGGSVSNESLKGKIVVLDMWATWCGWCFRGFPNLQTVYDHFKDNDKIAILAVNTDEPSISDALVRRAFEDNNLTIPIVRDQQQFNSTVFKVEGLPTMVVLGPSGAIEDFHVGFDANLAETLPKKLERLMAGENLAAEELARYEKVRQEYDAELEAAIVKE